MNNLTQETIKLSSVEFDELGKVYQSAFAGPPWYEVSKCPDISNRCESGFTSLRIGEICTRCTLTPTDEAYPLDELQVSLTERFSYSGSRLYREYDEDGKLLLAAILWEDLPEAIGLKKYRSVPAMQEWLTANLPNEPVVWLDEIFADRTRRQSGNLWNFKNLVEEVLQSSSCSVFAFRTINVGLVTKSSRSFGENCLVLKPGDVPDRRSLILIRRNEDE